MRTLNKYSTRVRGKSLSTSKSLPTGNKQNQSTKENAWELRAERNDSLGLSFLGILTDKVLQENWNVPPANEYLIINTHVAD